jgi:glycosyltransferase involved in cell wall biosynthesis
LIAETPEEFTSAVEKLITDSSLFEKISRNAIEYIHEKFDNLTLAGALVRFYKEHT